MKFISENKSSFSLEITPLIDIVFLLVIFFVVTSKVGDSQFLKIIVLIAIAFASLNIVGGFSVTGRILEMFKKND